MPGIKLYSWNVNGIRGLLRKDAMMPFIAQHQPEVLCLQETKAGKDHTDIELAGYNQYWNSASRPGYSGTAIFSKNQPLRTIQGFPDSFAGKYNFIDNATRDAANEGRVITAEFEQFYLVSVYTPNAKDDLSRIPLRQDHWDPAFLAFCLELQQTKPVVICGDLNVAHTPDDLARPKQNEGRKGFTKEERQGFQAYIDHGFIDTFRLFKKGNGYYSYWSNWGGARARNVGWRIDYFLVSGSLKNKVAAADIHPKIMGSDHCPISLTLSQE